MQTNATPAADKNAKSIAVVAMEIRRFVTRRAAAAGADIGNFRRMMHDDAADALIHSRGAIIAAARKGVFDGAAALFDSAEAFAVEVAGRKLTDAEHETVDIAGLRNMVATHRSMLYRVTRDLATERDSHRVVVQCARAAALAELLETVDDEIHAAEVSL